MSATNAYYNYSGAFIPGTLARAEALAAEFNSVATGFSKLSVQGTDTGVANAYVFTTPGYPVAAYNDGNNVQFKALNSNSGASTVNVNSIGAVPLLRYNGTALQAGDINAGSWYTAIYEATFGGFTIVSPSSYSTFTGSISTAAPTHKVGLTAAAGSANAAAPIDVTFAIDQSIVPTWTGQHIWTAAANAYGVVVNGSSTTGESFGVSIQAGTNGSDYALSVANQANTLTFLAINGYGNTTLTSNSGRPLTVTANSSSYACELVGYSSSGSSNGLNIVAGSTSGDYAVNVSNYAATSTLFSVNGVGATAIKVSSGYGLTVTSSGGSGSGFGVKIVAGNGTSDAALNVYNESLTQLFVVNGSGYTTISPSGFASAALTLDTTTTSFGYPVLSLSDSQAGYLTIRFLANSGASTNEIVSSSAGALGYYSNATSGTAHTFVYGGLGGSGTSALSINYAGAVTISNPTTISPSSGVALTVDQVSSAAEGLLVYGNYNNSVTLAVQNATSGSAALAQVELITGTTNSYVQMEVQDNSGSPYFQIYGGAAITSMYFNINGHTALSFNAAGNLTVNAPTSSTALTVNGVAGSLALAVGGSSSSTTTVAEFYGNYSGSGTSATIAISDTSNSNGASLALYGNGATTPNKFIRSCGGVFQIVSSAYTTVIFALADAGNVTLGATSGQTLTVNGVSGSYAAQFTGGSTTGSSYGVYVQAGTNASDTALNVVNHSLSNGLLVVNGYGNATLYATSGIPLTVGCTGSNSVVVVNSASGTTGGVSDVAISRSGSTAGTVQAGPNITLIDSTNSSYSVIQQSGGDTEFWQYNSGAWQQVMYFTYGSPSTIFMPRGGLTVGTTSNASAVGISVQSSSSTYAELALLAGSGTSALLAIANGTGASSYGIPTSTAGLSTGGAAQNMVFAINNTARLTLGGTASSQSAYNFAGSATTSGATAGSNGAVPSQVAGYWAIEINGSNVKIPYYNN